MSRGTTLKLVRIYPGKTVSDTDYAKLLAKEAESWTSGFSAGSCKANFKPAKLLPGLDRPDSVVLRDTHELADVLMAWTFTSQFTSLFDAYGLDSCSAERSIELVPEEDINAMRMALKYLLSKQYSPELDAAFSCTAKPWLELLADPSNGEPYAPYVFRNKPDMLADAMADSDGYADFSLQKLLAALDAYAFADSSEHINSRLVLAVEAWG